MTFFFTRVSTVNAEMLWSIPARFSIMLSTDVAYGRNICQYRKSAHLFCSLVICFQIGFGATIINIDIILRCIHHLHIKEVCAFTTFDLEHFVIEISQLCGLAFFQDIYQIACVPFDLQDGRRVQHLMSVDQTEAVSHAVSERIEA